MSRVTDVSRTTAAVVAITLVALVLRVVALGDRPFHWDEARVGVWSLRFARDGVFEYRPVAGGPLPYHLARLAFEVGGATDFVARLPVALVGGLLPLSALALRERLSGRETVFVAGVLALSPPLVYYSRFLRGDLLLAAAAFVACALAIRAVDTVGSRVVYGAALAVAAAVASSGFVVATVACVLVGALVALDARWVSADAVGRFWTALRGQSTLLARAALVLFLAIVLLFAPRGGGIGLFSALEFAVVDAPRRFVAVRLVSRWADGVTHPLAPFVASLLRTLLTAALPTLVLALLGTALERYTGSARPTVLFFAAWGGAALLVFPVVAEVDASWTSVHVLVPLAVPAGVGAARVFGWAQGALDRDDLATLAAVLLLLVAGVAQVGGVLASDVYGEGTTEGRLVDYAQPADDLTPFAANVSTAASGGERPTVLYYGDRFHTGEWSEADGPPVPDAWGERLPLAWYVAREGGTTTSVPSGADLPQDPPAIVVTSPADAQRVGRALSGYERSRYRTALSNREVVVFSRV